MTNIILFISFVVVVYLISKIFSYLQRYKTFQRLRKQWGKFPETTTDIDVVRVLFNFKEKIETKENYVLDDDTWKDLDMDEFFKIINRTMSPSGAQCLYDLLRRPLLNTEKFEDREKIIQTFLNDAALREKIQYALLPLSKPLIKYLVFSLWTPLPPKPKYAFILYWMAALAFWLLILALAGVVHWGFVMILFVINTGIYFLNKKKLEQFFLSFQYLYTLINVSSKVSLILENTVKDISNELNKNLETTRSIAYKIFSLEMSEENPLSAYFNIYFLTHSTGLYSALDKIKANLQNLQKLFETVGYIDAIISVASYRTQFPQMVIPKFSNDSKVFSVKDAYHPMLVDPVSNNFQFDKKNILITGSNMSGKTTFLKTIGVNAILAQTICVSSAAVYEAPLLRVISSIQKSDDLISSKSYYMAEVESVLRIINASQTENIYLFIIDEIFRGTNSIERTAASIEVLKYLNNKKDFTMIATHDLQLTEILKDSYLNYHFREEMADNGLHFDYKLHVGVATTKNAIALLEYVGYPKKIVDGAKNSIT